MASTTTTRLALVKPTAGTAEPVNVTTQLDNNWDAIDAAIGLTVCTSSTRPSSPFTGQWIFETDTGRTYFWNASVWRQVPTFGVASTHGITGSAAPFRLDTTSTTTGNRAMAFRKSGTSNDSYLVDFDGNMQWAPNDGSAGADTNLYRSAANTLKTDDNLIVAQDLTVTGNLNPSFRVKVTTNQTDASNNTTLFNITELVKAVASNKTYRFRLGIQYSASTVADAKMQVVGPAGSDISQWFFRGFGAAAMAYSDGAAAGGAVVGLGGNGVSTRTCFWADGFIAIGGTSGNIQIQWAKNTAEASTVTIYSGSFMELELMN